MRDFLAFSKPRKVLKALLSIGWCADRQTGSHIKDGGLHSYRYAWAERVYRAGMPEREAMAHLGHKSLAIHRAYARKADGTMPLEYYEDQKSRKVINFQTVLDANVAC